MLSNNKTQETQQTQESQETQETTTNVLNQQYTFNTNDDVNFDNIVFRDIPQNPVPPPITRQINMVANLSNLQ